MPEGYARWSIAQVLGTGGPWVRGTAGSRVGAEWVCFSEYWTYRNGIPDRERRLMRRCVTGASGVAIAADVGANVGLFTLELAALGFSEVHAFEPTPETFRRLKANVAANALKSRLFLNPLAIGEEEGTVFLQAEQRSPGTNHIASGLSAAGLEVPIITLDDYLATRNIPLLDFLKIDVEGWELAVLRGCRKTLRSKAVRVALVEVCPGNLSRYGFEPRHLLEEFASSGYLLKRLGEDGEPAQDLTPADLARMESDNAVAVPGA